MRFTYIVDEKVSGRYGIMKKDYKVAVAGTGARDIIRGCHNRDKGTAENERLRNPKFIFSYPKNERLIFLGGSQRTGARAYPLFVLAEMLMKKLSGIVGKIYE